MEGIKIGDVIDVITKGVQAGLQASKDAEQRQDFYNYLYTSDQKATDTPLPLLLSDGEKVYNVLQCIKELDERTMQIAERLDSITHPLNNVAVGHETVIYTTGAGAHIVANPYEEAVERINRAHLLNEMWVELTQAKTWKPILIRTQYITAIQ